jgi:Flp pilus assembly protein TadG
LKTQKEFLTTPQETCMKNKISHSQKHSAQAMVEFALVLPILLLLVYGLLEVGRLLFIYSSVVTSARSASRYGSTTGLNQTGGVPRYQDCQGMRTAAKNTTFLEPLSDANITIQHDKGEGQSTTNYCAPGANTDTSFTPQMNNERVRVTVTAQYTPILTLTPLQPFQITSTSARTILVSVAINMTSPPMTWDPNVPTFTPMPSATLFPSATPNYTPTNTATVTPYQSPTVTLPPTDTPIATSQAPQTFIKSGPLNGATNQPTTLTLTWSVSTAAVSYEYCYGTVNPCSNWTTNGAAINVTLSGLSAGTTYYWHVRAVNTFGTTYSDESTTDWSFTTAMPLPGIFSKAAPASGSANEPTSSLTLSWNASPGATSYDYCYDTVDPCTNWASAGTATSVTVTNLTVSATYYWHVRANNAYGTTYSDGSATQTWFFTTTGVYCGLLHTGVKATKNTYYISTTIYSQVPTVIHFASITVYWKTGGSNTLESITLNSEPSWSGSLSGSPASITTFSGSNTIAANGFGTLLINFSQKVDETFAYRITATFDECTEFLDTSDPSQLQH